MRQFRREDGFRVEDGKLYRHPAISVPIAVFSPIDVVMLRDRPDLENEYTGEVQKGWVFQIMMMPYGRVDLGTFKGPPGRGNGTPYGMVADIDGNTLQLEEGVDFEIVQKASK